MKNKKNSAIVAIALAVSLAFGLTGPITAFAAGPATVDLGTAGDFVILSKTAITTTGVTSITGDIGVSPAAAAAMTGFGLVMDVSNTFSTSALVVGRVYASDYTPPTPAKMTAAVSAMEAAYTDATSRPTDVLNAGAGNLAGLSLVAGVYTFDGAGNVTITDDVTLSGGASDVWIFQIPGTLNISASKKILLSGGALASNVFWAVAGTTTLQANSTFEGNILGGPGASTIAGQNGAILHGRALGQTDVTLIGNTVSNPVTTPTPESSPSRGYAGLGNYLTPLIGFYKIPAPLALPDGPGAVVYNYTIWNAGQQPITNINITDDKCSQITYVSGDVNNNQKLNTGENWKYKCSMTLSQTTTNTAIATGYSDGIYHQTAIAKAIATVVVGSSATPPLINIVKVPSRLTPFLFGGGSVTYTYVVTNPGAVSMNSVVVSDDKCGPVSGPSGDANSNNLLDPNEVWTYTCKTNVSVSTMNTATASGKANGLTAVGYAYASVLVSAAPNLASDVPGLPNTGFPSEGKNTSWNIALLAGILILASVSLVVALKKRTAND